MHLSPAPYHTHGGRSWGRGPAPSCLLHQTRVGHRSPTPSPAVWTPAQPSRQPLAWPLRLCWPALPRARQPQAPDPLPSIPILISDCGSGWSLRQVVLCGRCVCAPGRPWSPQAPPLPSVCRKGGSTGGLTASFLVAQCCTVHSSPRARPQAGVHHLAQLSEANSLPKAP